jgi:hypothetical protein
MIFTNDVIRKDFFSEILIPILDSMNDYLYPLNNFTAYHLSQKNYATLKTFVSENTSSSCGVDFYSNQISHLTTSQITIAKEWIDSQFSDFNYVYIGSKSSLKNLFFSDFLPTSFDLLYNYLTNNNYIKQIGKAFGSAILFNSSLLSEPFHINVNLNFDQSIEDSFKNFTKAYNSLKVDNEYLCNLIDQKNVFINTLTKKVEELEYKNYLNSQMTWN